MSEPTIADVSVDLDYNVGDDKIRIDLQIIAEALQRIQDYLNDHGSRIYDLENP